jgi:DNA processing protein
MTSAGCHQACRDGYAVLVTDVDEIMELVGTYGADAMARPVGPVRAEDHVDAVGRAVLAALPVRKAIDAATLAANAGVTLTQTVASLGRLELAGVAVRDGERWRQVSRRGR